MFSLKDYIKVLDRMKKVGEELLDIDKESGGLISSLEKDDFLHKSFIKTHIFRNL